MLTDKAQEANAGTSDLRQKIGLFAVAVAALKALPWLLFKAKPYLPAADA